MSSKVITFTFLSGLGLEFKSSIANCQPPNRNLLCKTGYRTCSIITCYLYVFYPSFESQKRFLKSFFCKILTLCMVSIQVRFQIKSGLFWRAYSMQKLQDVTTQSTHFCMNTEIIFGPF